TIPFWIKYGIDWTNGGICTCISDDGRVLSDDKYMWSQLRAIWTFSALCNKIERRSEWLDVARNIYNFATQHGRDENGNWVFLVDKNGKHLQGATSIYADGFAIYSLTEFARATGDADALQLARATYANVQRRLAQPGSYGTAPLPIPPGAKAHGISMIFSLIFTELGELLNDSAILRAGLDHANQVMNIFLRDDRKRLYEFARLDDALLDVPPGRVVNPGHVLESMWFMIHIFQRIGDHASIARAIEAIKWHIELGWDEEFGGIVLARDAEGSFWENKWDTKIWWPHTEALYALLLAYSICKEQWCLDWFQRVHDYAFAHFPVPQYGEWTQNLDRRGNKLNTTIALPVKDPFHLPRALIYCVRALEKLSNET
ncbi:MAG: AGE family epimerase/isomerase, partial [Anaerolineales bacterium]|nr:AGE family epimerase/isomerase [Anaerolineales bacterium]